MLRLILFSICLLMLPFQHFSQVPSPALVGYWHNWNDFNAPYIPLDQVDPRYNIIDVSFAIPQPGTDYNMQFNPDQVTPQTFIWQVQALQNEGRKVMISVGGATAPVYLDDEFERDIFVSSMGNIINTYGFDGMDIDLEGSSTLISGGTIEAPANVGLINLIEAVRQIMANYYNEHGERLILTMAPETAFVQGGMSAFGGIWGGYLPVIHALRDSIEILHVQLYNSGSMYGIDGGIYTQGTADFIVAMTEAVIQGFTTGGGFFEGLPANKVAVGLPSCISAAGGGYTAPSVVQAAVDYLRGMGPQPGDYSLSQSGGYPDLRGMMTWSINWDAATNCSGAYQYAQNFEDIFQSVTLLEDVASDSYYELFPNPTLGELNIILKDYRVQGVAQLFNAQGKLVGEWPLTSNRQNIQLSAIPSGLYFFKVNELVQKLIKN